MSQIEYVTAKELAEMCRVTVATVRVWRRRKIGPQPILVGSINLYKREEAIEWAKVYIPFFTSYQITKARNGK
jgi:DNA-binding transcriptional MerR regulator